MSVLSESVSSPDGGETYDFRCPGVAGSPCGDQGVPFTSTGWPTKKVALARGGQHLTEHETGEVAQELDEFRKSQGLGD